MIKKIECLPESAEIQRAYARKIWQMLDDTELEEILACMEDSDRYIHKSNKDRLIKEIKTELHYRGHIVY